VVQRSRVDMCVQAPIEALGSQGHRKGDASDMAAWIRAATKSQISGGDAAAYAQVLIDSGFDSVELLSGLGEDLDERIGEWIPTVIHRRLLKNAIRSLPESSAPAAASLAAVAAENATDEAIAKESTEDPPAVLMLKLHVSGPTEPICSVSLDAASSLGELKAAIAKSSSISTLTQRLFYGTKELVGEGSLADLLPLRALEEELIVVRRSPSEIAELDEDALSEPWDLGKSTLSFDDFDSDWSDEDHNSDLEEVAMEERQMGQAGFPLDAEGWRRSYQRQQGGRRAFFGQPGLQPDGDRVR